MTVAGPQARALEHLKMWVDKHPDYAAIAGTVTHAAMDSAEEQVCNLYKAVSEAAPTDPAPRVVLGVAYNLTGSLDFGAEALKEATKLAPTDYATCASLCSAISSASFGEPVSACACRGRDAIVIVAGMLQLYALGLSGKPVQREQAWRDAGQLERFGGGAVRLHRGHQGRNTLAAASDAHHLFNVVSCHSRSRFCLC
jgi:hypothetical protein